MNSQHAHSGPRGRRAHRQVASRSLQRLALAGVCLLAFAAHGAPLDPVDFERLPSAVVNLLEAPPLAAASVDPGHRYLLLVHERGLVERSSLATPVVSIAGRRIDPQTDGPHAPLSYYGFSVIDLVSGRRSELRLPRDVTVGFPFWAPDGSRFAFTLTAAHGTELWIGEPSEGRARRLVGGINAVFSRPCMWMPDGRDVLCRRVAGAGTAPTPPAPATDDWTLPSEATSVLLETTPPSNDYVEQLLESQLQMIDVLSGQRHDIGQPAAIKASAVAPSQAFLLVTRIAKPYPRIDGIDQIHTVTEVWDRFGRVVETLPASRRAVQWQAGKPATLVWVQREQGQDRLMAQTPPFTSDAVELFASAQRFAGLEWLQAPNLALLSEYVPDQRSTRQWLIDAGPERTPPRQLGSRQVDADSGLPVKTHDRWGRSVIAVHDGALLLRGETSTADGRGAAYIDRVALDTGARQRLWTHAGDGYERVVDILSDDARLLLVRAETADTPPNYYLAARDTGERVALTHDKHAAPALAHVAHIPLEYARDDGFPLSATLYVPPGADQDSPLPLVVWAYPKQVGGSPLPADAASAERYIGSDRALKLFFLLCGYAVMDNVSMPIVGSGRDANDSFVEQIVANARATIDAAANTGLIDASRIAVAGHSYGAFMVANLLAHSHLFRAGAALSGAYNRTLTPFGFQTERRTLWEAPDTYLAMSPLLYSNRIEAPLLLVHGMADTNAGTPPIQSLQFYQAIRGNGGRAELLLLPREGHTYRARESVLETAAAMLDWFDRYLKAPATQNKSVQTSAALVQ